MANEYNKHISLQCPTCGCTDFEIHENETYTCASCNRLLSKDEMLQENQELISNTLDEIKDQFTTDMQKQLKGIFKKWK